ncbi:hypothetical protein K474DRAFT_969502 [Panus rudis PR-1116 ss-1]|nr:hypothetical protein K474DRAFT_969502 [Panus rudis PR-1116 ss-1]
MSARSLRKRPRISYIEVSSEEDEAVSDFEELPQDVVRPPSKRRKASLDRLPDLPADILCEIFSHLEPLDLIHLIRTNKALRRFLLNRNATSVWKAARQHVDLLPERPSFLSEPAYANLMFDPHCHACLTGNIHNTIFAFNVRYCNRCKNNLTVDSWALGGGRNGLTNGLTADMFNHVMGDRKRVLYHKPEVEGIWQTWTNLQGDDARQKFMEERRAYVREISAHVKLCERWFIARRASRSGELQEMKQAKLQRLSDLGWGEELEFMKPNYFQIKEHNLFRQAKKINDRTWQEMKDPLVNVLKKVKKDRLIAERKKMYRTRLNLLVEVLKKNLNAKRDTSSDYCQPSFVDYAMMPEVRQVLEWPIQAENLPELINKLGPLIPHLSLQWQLHCDQRLSALAHAGTGTFPEADSGILYLATTFFDCTSCRKRGMRYPGVAGHECLRHRYYGFYRDEEVSYIYDDVVQCVDRCRPWSCECLTVSRSSQVARSIVRACGKDPDITTRADMLDLDPRLCCLSCSRPGALMVMTWLGAVEHARTVHNAIDLPEPRWVMVDEKMAKLVREIEELKSEQHFGEHCPKILWSCAHCITTSNRNLAMAQALEHVRTAHGIAQPSGIKGDIYISADSPDFIPRPVLLASKELKGENLTNAEKKYISKNGGGLIDFSKYEDFDKLKQKALRLSESNFLNLTKKLVELKEKSNNLLYGDQPVEPSEEPSEAGGAEHVPATTQDIGIQTEESN